MTTRVGTPRRPLHQRIASVFSLVLAVLLVALPAEAARKKGSTADRTEQQVRLPGHVLPALKQARLVDSFAESAARNERALTLTFTLRRDDQAGFERYLREVYDPKSEIYRRFLDQSEITARFGPSRKAYDDLLAYLRRHGFELIEGSANRMTLTVRGTRLQAEQSLSIHIGDYRIGDRPFFANDRDPALPREIALSVQAVSGLANLAQPFGLTRFLNCFEEEKKKTVGSNGVKCFGKLWEDLVGVFSGNGPGTASDPAPGDWVLLDGSGQTVGLIEFDNFEISDVADYLAFSREPASRINNLSSVAVNGGAPLGANQHEVLLDINAVLKIAPGANVVVYHAPFSGPGTSFQALFNAAINGGSTVISNSWAYCESQTTLADVQSIESILQTAASAGISVFNASGDSGSTCLDGSANTVAVPAGSPSATAVGGTSARPGPGFTYGVESWWDGTNDTPPTGQGGFGVSRFFSRPSYQDGFTASTMRSVPDVATNGDPARGVLLCQSSAGGCPTGLLYGGTSAAAPRWAAFTAILNQAQGHNLGFLNPILYPIANTSAFHSAASMGSDFSHVGLGSPNLNVLHLLLTGQAADIPNAATTEVSFFRAEDDPVAPGETSSTVAADGSSTGYIVVRLRDLRTNTVSGKTVSLTANPSGNVVITPPTAVTTVDNGAAIFRITNLVPETVTFTATDTTDGVVAQQTATVDFVVPPATSAVLIANPPNVQANGTSTAVITVTLKDSLNRPTPGKLIRLSQGSGHSVITGPTPPVTDANGVITFTATNLVNETITYSAVDATDGDLPIPGNPQVTFSNGSGTACGQNGAPTAGAGFVLTPFATGFNAGNFFFGGVNWNGCWGAQNPAFDTAGSVFVPDFKAGKLYKLDANGGAISSSNLLATLTPTLAGPVFGKDGRLYAPLLSGGSGLGGGSVVELDAATGAQLRTVASGLTCPSSLAVDPISGDLFFDDQCFDAGFNNPNIYRIQDPASATPTIVLYTTLPASPNALMAFAPNGSLYVVNGYGSGPTAPVLRVAGTNTATPGAFSDTGVRSDYSLAIGEVLPSGEAKSLIVHQGFDLKLIDIATKAETVLGSGGMVAGVSGPDGCLYMQTGDTLYKLSNASGGCTFATTSPSPSLSLALAAGSPNPVQGGSQTLVATLRNVATPTDIPVFFSVTGANAQPKLVRADANGLATLSYVAALAGQDRIRAIATVGETTLTSNAIELNWAGGRHTTFLTLNPSPRGGTPGQPVTVVASLTDVSVDPTAPVAGQTVSFALGSSTCNVVTGPTGLASCQLTPASEGPSTLTAQFLAAGNLVGSSASVGFNVMAAVSQEDQTPPALNLPAAMTVEATGANGAVVNFNVTATDAVDPNPTVSCTPQSGATLPLGTSSVSCTASDASGNTSAAGSFDVTVQDTTAPAFANVPANITTTATSAAGAVVTYASPNANDLVSGGRPVSCAPASGSTFPIGTTPVACAATDAAGNSGTAGFTVTVQDGTPPPGSQKTICTVLGHKGLPDIDVFQFEGKANETVKVRLAADPAGASKGSHAALVLFGFNLLKMDASALPNTLTAKLSKKGSYFIKVAEEFFRKDKFTGNYCLTLESSMGGWQSLRQW